MILPALLLALAPQDVVIFVLDDIGYEDLHRPGLSTPNLDQLATRGVTFTRCYANPTCAPSRFSLMTGHWWASNGGAACVAADSLTPLLAEKFLPERLPRHVSALFGKWHLGGCRLRACGYERAPLSQGFDHWICGQPVNLNGCGGSGYTNWLRIEHGVARMETAYEPDVLRDSFMSSWPRGPSPKIAVVCPALAHTPFHVPPGSHPFLPPDQRYSAMIEYLDRTIGKMLAVVDLDTTLVMVVGDNGTPPQHAPEPNRAKTTTFERGVRVPLIIAGGPVVAPGRTSDELVHIVDLYQTAIDWGGGNPTASTPYPNASRTLMPLLRKATYRPRTHVICGNTWKIPGTPGDSCIVSADGFKLRQLDADGDGNEDSEELYDLLADPNETTNLVATQPALAASLRPLLETERLP